MYAAFFGLKQEPFSIAPDPRYLFMSKRHREALAHLLYGLKGGGGFVLLSGDIGAGKTTVCRCMLEQIPKRCNVAYIFNPKLTVRELLKTICDEFGISDRPKQPALASVKDYIDPLNEFLLRTHAVGQNNVLIVDEAQMLSADVLEQLRLLTNLETNERKLLQIVLIGQPELRTLLNRPELEQLAQRVIARFHLGPLSPEETKEYIWHRLSVAGMKGAMPFDRAAVARIHDLARGIPRRINLLCDRAMLGAYSKGSHRIGRDIVDKAALEVFGRPVKPAGMSSRSRRAAAAVAAGVVVVTAAAALAFASGALGGRRGAAPGAASTLAPAVVAATPAVGASALASAAAAPAAPTSASAPAATSARPGAPTPPPAAASTGVAPTAAAAADPSAWPRAAVAVAAVGAPGRAVGDAASAPPAKRRASRPQPAAQTAGNGSAERGRALRPEVSSRNPPELRQRSSRNPQALPELSSRNPPALLGPFSRNPPALRLGGSLPRLLKPSRWGARTAP